ncbi:MAG: hypothetical protein RLZZ428_1058, partial [Pseudomonadota bacterium]
MGYDFLKKDLPPQSAMSAPSVCEAKSY